MIGKKVAHYEIRSRLGGGGMGVVYKAWDTRLERWVALKFLSPHLVSDSLARERFVREAKSASALDHPNIGTIHEIGETDDGSLYICMTYYPGQSVRDVLRRGPLVPDQALHIARQVSRALDAAHRAGLVHRDVKPANVLLTQDGGVKLVDFGLAKLVGSADLTTPGSNPGTPAYMSPEQLRGSEVDERSDLWALGVLVYEMLVGENPFARDHLEATRRAVLDREPPPPSSQRPGLAPEIDHLVTSLLRQDPDQRPWSAAEVERDLALLQSGDSALPTRELTATLLATDDVTGAPSPSRGSYTLTLDQRTAWIGGGLLAVLLVAMAIFLLRPGTTDARAPAPTSVAVADFRPFGDSSLDAALARGFTHATAHRLAAVGELWVSPLDPAIEADLVLAGEIELRDDRLRLRYHLEPRNGQSPWADGEVAGPLVELFELQDQMLRDVLEAVRRELGLEVELAADPRSAFPDADAARAYLRARGLLAGPGSVRPAEQQQAEAALEEFGHPDRLAEAIRLFEALTARQPELAEAWAGLGRALLVAYSLDGAPALVDRAEKACLEAAGRAPDLAESRLCLGDLYRHQGALQAAIEEYLLAIELAPANRDAWGGLARAEAAHGLESVAEEDFRRAIELDPRYWGGFNALAVHYQRLDRYQEALEQYRLALERSPRNATLHYNLGGLLLLMGRYGEAIEALERSLGIHETAAAWSNLGYAFYSLRRFEPAADAFERATSLPGASLRDWGNLARAQVQLGRREEAEASLERAIAVGERRLRVNPDDSDTRILLAFYQSYLGRPDTTVELERALELLAPDPNGSGRRAHYLYLAAIAWEQLGERERAVEALEQSLRASYSPAEVIASVELDDLRTDPRIRELLPPPPTDEERP